MSVSASENHRIVWRDLVQIPARRKHRRLPVCFDPATAGDPLARFCLVHARLHFREQIFETRRAFEVQRHLTKSDTGEMLVCVCESG